MGLESTSKFKVISSKSGKRMKKNYKSESEYLINFIHVPIYINVI